jgi:hypothetical protein
LYTPPEMLPPAGSMPDTKAQLWLPKYGPAADCWALGLTAFKLLTGECLFKPGEDSLPSDLDPGMEEEWIEWETRLTAELHVDWVRTQLYAMVTPHLSRKCSC